MATGQFSPGLFPLQKHFSLPWFLGAKPAPTLALLARGLFLYVILWPSSSPTAAIMCPEGWRAGSHCCKHWVSGSGLVWGQGAGLGRVNLFPAAAALSLRPWELRPCWSVSVQVAAVGLNLLQASTPLVKQKFPGLSWLQGGLAGSICSSSSKRRLGLARLGRAGAAGFEVSSMLASQLQGRKPVSVDRG